MKYGVEIDRRSVPEWRAHNVDYNEVKQLIKKATSHDKSESSKKRLFNQLYNTLVEEFTSVDLFVKLKSGEIDRRIQDCEKIVETLAAQEKDTNTEDSSLTNNGGGDSNLHSKVRQSRLFKLHQEISTLTKDIQSLSRFVGVQRTGFFKLLKKYKKWSGSEKLSEMFMPILEAPDSFVFEDFTSKFLELSLLYSVLRYPKFTSIKQNISVTFSKESYNKFDCDMITSLTNSDIFWVHPDNIVELSVTLLKNLVLYNVNTESAKLKRTQSHAVMKHSQSFTGLSMASAGNMTDHQSHTSTVPSSDEQNSSTAGFAHVVYLDDAKFRSAKTGKEPGQIRWVDTELDTDPDTDQGGPKRVLCAPVGGLRYFSTISINQDDYMKIYNNDVKDINFNDSDHSANLALGWLKNRNAFPVSEVSYDRTRFVNPKEEGDKTSTSDGGGAGKIWATLDSSISIQDLRRSGSDTPVEHFPYSVLEIRWTGSAKPAFVRELAKSHLVQRMQGFSLYAHSVAFFNSDALESDPFWMTILRDKVDIRKAPQSARPAFSKRESTRSLLKASASSNSYSKLSSPSYGSNPALTPGILLNDSRSSALTSEDSSATEPMTPRKLLSSLSPDSNTPVKNNEQRTLDVRYWNEFDNPEDGEGDFGVFLIPEDDDRDGILSDNNIEAIIDFSSKVFTRLNKLKSAFTRQRPDRPDNERTHLLLPSDDDDDDDNETTGLSSPESISRSRNFSSYSPRFKPRRNTGLNDYDYEAFGDDISAPYYGSTEERRNKVLTILYTTCFAFASLITAVMFGIILGEDMSEVSVATYAFTVCGFTISLSIGILGMCFFTLREVQGWAHQTAVFAIFFSIVCFGVGGICWILSI